MQLTNNTTRSDVQLFFEGMREESYLPLLTLRPRLLFSFKGSIILRFFLGKARELDSADFGETENMSTQFLKNSSLSTGSSSLSGLWTKNKHRNTSSELTESIFFHYYSNTGRRKRLKYIMRQFHELSIAYLLDREYMKCKLDHSNWYSSSPNQICYNKPKIDEEPTIGESKFHKPTCLSIV